MTFVKNIQSEIDIYRYRNRSWNIHGLLKVLIAHNSKKSDK